YFDPWAELQEQCKWYAHRIEDTQCRVGAQDYTEMLRMLWDRAVFLADLENPPPKLPAVSTHHEAQATLSSLIEWAEAHKAEGSEADSSSVVLSRPIREGIPTIADRTLRQRPSAAQIRDAIQDLLF